MNAFDTLATSAPSTPGATGSPISLLKLSAVKYLFIIDI
jgi:hypothetical protein